MTLTLIEKTALSPFGEGFSKYGSVALIGSGRPAIDTLAAGFKYTEAGAADIGRGRATHECRL